MPAMLSVTAVITGLSAARPATALMAKSRPGVNLHWELPTIHLTIVEPHPNSGVTLGELRDALLSGIAVWNHATRDCRVPRLSLSETTENRHWLAQDGRSLVMVQSSRECSNEDSRSSLCIEKEVAARTHFYRPSPSGTGTKVAEADLELNAASYTWDLEGRGHGNASLRRTIHHELGHVLGLDHPCTERVSQGAVSEHGALPCDGPEVQHLLMHPAAPVLGEAVSLNPSATDVAELCREYGHKPWFVRLVDSKGWSLLALCAGIAGLLTVKARL